jgi:hypothetical protein
LAWWAHTFVSEVRQLENGRAYEIRSGPFAGRRALLSDFVEDCFEVGMRPCVSTRQACAEWGSGAYLFETMPSVLHILARWAHHPEDALIRAVNDTEDSNTIAALVGAALGALHGADAWPARWQERLLTRVEADDDGGLFEVLATAQRLFTPEADRLWRRVLGGARLAQLEATRECKRRTILVTRHRFQACSADRGAARGRDDGDLRAS